VKNRNRVDTRRGAVWAALSGQGHTDATTAAIISLLHRIGGLGVTLDVNDDHLRRAGEIASGTWADGSNTAEVNLALTAAAVLPALG
jgi:hypothetical protein